MSMGKKINNNGRLSLPPTLPLGCDAAKCAPYAAWFVPPQPKAVAKAAALVMLKPAAPVKPAVLRI